MRSFKPESFCISRRSPDPSTLALSRTHSAKQKALAYCKRDICRSGFCLENERRRAMPPPPPSSRQRSQLDLLSRKWEHPNRSRQETQFDSDRRSWIGIPPWYDSGDVAPIKAPIVSVCTFVQEQKRRRYELVLAVAAPAGLAYLLEGYQGRLLYTLGCQMARRRDRACLQGFRVLAAGNVQHRSVCESLTRGLRKGFLVLAGSPLFWKSSAARPSFASMCS